MRFGAEDIPEMRLCLQNTSLLASRTQQMLGGKLGMTHARQILNMCFKRFTLMTNPTLQLGQLCGRGSDGANA